MIDPTGELSLTRVYSRIQFLTEAINSEIHYRFVIKQLLECGKAIAKRVYA